MDIFVTGATGVLGRPVVRALVAVGHRVRALSRSAQNSAVIRGLGGEPVEGDLFNAASMREAMAGCSAVLHLATKIPPTVQMGLSRAWVENDRIRREGSHALVDAALAAGVAVFVYPSVCLVYPDSGATWIDAETTPPEAAAIQSTLDAEAEVARFTADGRRGIVLRMGAFYGPEAASTRDQLRLARLGIAPVPGPADAYFSSIWIPDAARAVVAALGDVQSGVYDIVDDEPQRRGELIGVIAHSLGRRRLLRMPGAAVRIAMGNMGEFLSRSQRVSNQRFKEASGWAPEVPDARAGWALLAERGLERPGGESPRDVGWPVKAGLAFLAAGGLVVGLWAQLAPLAFYQSFPGFGHRWVMIDGPYNEHLIRDVGGGFLALAVFAILALLRPSAALVGATGLTTLVSGLPHFIYHLLHIGLLPTTLDQILQTTLLAAIPAVAALLVWKAAHWDATQRTGGNVIPRRPDRADLPVAPLQTGSRRPSKDFEHER